MDYTAVDITCGIGGASDGAILINKEGKIEFYGDNDDFKTKINSNIL